MQPAIKNDLVYLLRILESIEKIQIYSNQFTEPEEFFSANEQQNFNATLALLLNICEQSSKLSKQLTETYQQIKWKEIYGYRNRLAHDYTGIDQFITFEIIRNDLPVLKNDLTKIISEQLRNKNFDAEELNAARGSEYYRHIHFDEWL